MLNVSYICIVEGMDESERAAFDKKLAKPATAQRPESTGTQDLMRAMMMGRKR